MALVVRTTIQGEGNTLVALDTANTYFSDRAVTAWADADDPAREAALIRATDYIDTRFGDRFTDEALALTEVPVKLQRAACEYALRALSARLAPDPVLDAAGVPVVTVRSKLGPLEEQFQVVGNGSPDLLRSYPEADMLLKGLLNPAAQRVIR